MDAVVEGTDKANGKSSGGVWMMRNINLTLVGNHRPGRDYANKV